MTCPARNGPEPIRPLIRLIRKFPRGSIWQTRYICLPVTLVASTLILSHGALPLWQKASWFGLGVFAWTFLEYVLHRFVLHWRAKTEVGKEVVARLHELHHQDPKDEDQVCVPLAVSLPLWIALFGLMSAFGGNEASLAVTCGIALMMVVYDIAHYSAHYMDATNSVLKFLKRQHMLHHFSDHKKRFGVTTPLWDWVFGTAK